MGEKHWEDVKRQIIPYFNTELPVIAEFRRKRRIKIIVAAILMSILLAGCSICALGVMALTEAGPPDDESSRHRLQVYLLGWLALTIPWWGLLGYTIALSRKKPPVRPEPQNSQ
jgi:hypothetical protein